ncbi:MULTISPECIES: fimbrial protein [Chromobacterium]|uniref:Type 1 fimbrial protein n=1 Tax=Chromobacterium fluminis TaxID=3044269 RepID=A0ABX0L8B1_9NEIS|nr:MULTISPECIES: fimbrial protein [Chromobacterium]MCP1290682.1 type 1 fimbrial protein [Chromobacterium sp. S0633]NHR07945.1 type 1 fimbrial protein [Chromobacterium haemolyticum]OQS32307.1 hypothetical protein B0T39_22720 [Chromobacterium haemolyticum]PTU65582.1 type 1 fimbrial protein [Chromobacterium sp. Panama]UJB30337.1 type 1 fimbrial protein [Chromobacterium sp. Beijing]
MKFKAMVLALALAAPLAQAADGTLNVFGELVLSACGLDPNSQSLEVGMGLVSSQMFRKIGDRSRPVSFDIRLTECSIDTMTTVAVRFNGEADRDNGELMAINGSAAGVGIRLMGPGGGDIVLGQYSPLVGLTNGSNTLRFNAMYESTRAPVPQGQEGGIKPGSANGLAQFDLRYM